MSHKVGIWIDLEKAVIVFAWGNRVTMTTLESKVGLRPRSSDRAADPAADGARDNRGRKKCQGDYGRLLDRYYDEVVRLMARPEALLIFGPGEAKLQLKERLSRSRGLCDRIVGIHTTEALSNPQIVAKVREHYGILPSAAGTGGNR